MPVSYTHLEVYKRQEYLFNGKELDALDHEGHTLYIRGQGGGTPIQTPPAAVIGVAESVDFSRQSSQGKIQPLKAAPQFAFLPPDVEGMPLMIQGIQFFAIKQVFRVKAAIRFKNLPGRFRKVIV